MYNTAPAFKTLMAQPSRTLSARGLVIYPDLAQQALTAAQISSFTITENAGDHLPLGTAGASTLTLKLDNRNGEWEQGGSIRGSHKIEGAEVQLELGVWNGTAYLWENVGRYILENARGQEQETLIQLKGMDYLGNKAQRAFIDDLAYPMTLAAMADLACFQAGFTRKAGAFLNSTVNITTRPDWPGDISCRDALAYIAQAAGGFARIDRNGQLEIVTLPKAANVTLAPDRYKTLTRQAETFTLNAVIFEGREASEDSPAIEPSRVATVPGMADNVLNSTSIINPLLLPGKYNALKTPLTNALLGLSFIGAELKWQGDPTVTCGDCVEVTDLDGAKQKVIIAHNELSFTPGFEMTSGNQLANDAQAGTDSSKERIFTLGGKLNAAAIDGKIQRAQIGIAAIGEAQIDDLSVTTAKIDNAAITNAKIGTAAVETANIKDANIETAKIKDAAITTAKIKDGDITNAKIKDATIETAKIKDAAITTAKIKDADITNAKIANAGIDYAKIKDLTTDTAIIQDGIGNRLVIGRLIVTDANLEAAIVGKLVIRDTDGRFYRISINSSTGAVTASQVQMNGDSLTDNAVTSVSQRMLWRQATAPASPWVGMLWQDTTNDQLKRCRSLGPPVVWEIIPAGAVHTSVIDVDDNGMIVASTGSLELLAGSTLKIKNLNNSANIIEMDNIGMQLSSTGKINLVSGSEINVASGGKLNLTSADDLIVSSGKTLSAYANEQITLEVGAYQDGGTNLIPNSDFTQGIDVKWNGTSKDTNPAYSIDGKKIVGRVISEVGDGTIEMYSSRIQNNLSADTTFTFSVWTYFNSVIRNNFGTSVLARIAQYDADDVMIENNTSAIYLADFPSQSDGWWRASKTFTMLANCSNFRVYLYARDSSTQYRMIMRFTNLQLEPGTKATPWRPAAEDPASGVKTSHITVQDDTIDIASGGKLNLSAADQIKIGVGALDTYVTSAVTSGITGKNAVFYGSSTPAASTTGDLWYDTSGTQAAIKRWNGSSWATITDTALAKALDAASTADGKAVAADTKAGNKRTIWAAASAPTSLAANDLWINTNDKNKIYIANKVGANAIGTSGGWVLHQVSAGHVQTTGVTIDGNNMDITAVGKLNIASGGEMNLQAADQVKIGAGSDTLATFTDGKIALAVSGVQVGGSNLLPNSDFRDQGAWTISGGGVIAWPGGLSYLRSATLRVNAPNGTTSTYARSMVPYKGETGVPLTFSFWCFSYSAGFTTTNYDDSDFVARVVFYDADTNVLSGHLNITAKDARDSGFRGNSKFTRIVKTFPNGAPSGTAQIQIRLHAANKAGTENSYLIFNSLQLEHGNKVTDWSISSEDPASGVKTTYMKMLNDLFEVYSGGSVNIFAGSDFNVRAGKQAKHLGISNNEADGFMLWAGSQVPATAPFSVTMEGALKATNLDGSFVLGVENGGTGETENRTHRGSSVPSSSLGRDGDMYVLFNGAVGTTWNNTNLSFGSNAQGTYFGVNRNWNEQPVTSYRRIGNGIGSASSRYGVHASFVCPASTKTLTFKLNTTKQLPGTGSLSSGTTTYRVELRNSLTGTLLASGSVEASISGADREVTLTASNNLTQGTTYYLGIFLQGNTEMTGAAIYGNIVLKGSASSSIGSAIYVKTNGAWVRLAYE